MIGNVILTCVFAAILILLWFCIYDSTRFVVVRYQIKNNKIKGKFRAVVLADLHDKQYGKENALLLSEIERLQPDCIWIAGDIPTAVPGRKLDRALHFLEALGAKYPICYGNGNHEQRMKLYPETYGNMAEEYAKGLEKTGISPLVNESHEIKDYNMVVFGVEIGREYYKRFSTLSMDEAYLEGLLGKVDPNRFNVLLAHNPDYFDAYASWGADLVLAGHVHGGMVRIPGWKGVVSPAVRLFPKYDGGMFKKEHSIMILSRGLGMHTIPIRLFNPAEIVVVELEGET